MTARRLVRDCRASSAAEFALVLPLLLILLFGIIDGGRFMWEYNRATKATQVGVREAAVTDVVPQGLLGIDYVGQTVDGVTLTQGDVIPAGALGTLSCSETVCTCTAGTCPAAGTINSTSFNRIVARMQTMMPQINKANVRVEYSGSGLGFAGDPDTSRPEISPMVTVRLSALPEPTALKFVPITSLLFAQFTMSGFASSMPGEDLSGSQSN
jgi:Flp pilus assembly protein TadG